MTSFNALNIMFVAGFGPIVRDPAASREFYLHTFGLPLEAMPGNDAYMHTEKLDGVRHFALWPLASAAESCFGAGEWPESVPAPQSWIEFEVEDLAVATRVLKGHGCTLLVENRTEPWGQSVTRLLSPEGILVGLTITPWLRR
jgi:catechol 2,3-dioxygenase-like lactoylglutathione lyase family enzyme